MTDERVGDEHSTGKRTVDETWVEVGRQFQALGESLAMAFRTVWESEENRQHLESMRAGLTSMVQDIDQAVEDASASPEAQQARSEMEKMASSARAAAEKGLQDVQPHLLSALEWINVEMQGLIDRLRQEEQSEPPE
jgi:hypothetical protein